MGFEESITAVSPDDQPVVRRGRHAANWYAQAARSLVRNAHRETSQRRAVAVGIIAGMWLSLTLTGSFLHSNEHHLSGRIGDAIYNSLTFLAPRDGYSGVGRYPPLPPMLWWGRFFGVALTMLAIVWAALHRSRGFLASYLIRSHASGHMIVLSSDGFADMLAKGSAEEGHCVVLIERSVSNERIEDLGRAGVVVMPEDASLSRWLGGCRVKYASSVIAWMKGDSLSLANAFMARHEMSGANTEIIVRVDRPEMQRSLRSAPELLQTNEGRMRPVSPTVSSVRDALSGADYVENAIQHGFYRVHVALHGSTLALGVIASLVLRHNWSIHLGAPMVSWDTGLDREAWRDWTKYNYCFVENSEAAFGEDEPPSISVYDDTMRPGRSDISCHVVDYGDDDHTIAGAFDLASRLAQQSSQPKPVQAVLRSAHAARELLIHSRNLVFAKPILIDADTSFHAFVAGIDNQTAERIHDVYVKEYSVNATATTNWREIDETYFHANRAASDHRVIKQLDIARARADGMEESAMIEHLARVEHYRWKVERLLDGWAPAKVRDNDRRLHNNLVGWSDLSPADRAKDILMVRTAIESL